MVEQSVSTVAISISNGLWTYTPAGPWIFNKAGKLQFTLGGGYTLAGISFTNPVAAAQGGLNKFVVRLSADESSTLTLTDEDLQQGTYSFLFIATDPNGKAIVSPDPQVINRPNPPPL